MFDPSRLILARKIRGLTKKSLSLQIGLSDRMLLSYEKGEASPSESTLSLLAETLGFQSAFFKAEEIQSVNLDKVSFRALSRLPALKRDSALAAGELAVLITEWIDERFQLPEVELPDMRGCDPELAAETLRAEWGLGSAPIKNLSHLVESKGVRIFSLPAGSSEVDAFCFWKSGLPFMLLNTSKSAERSRFDIAHELGHLILHQSEKPQGKVAEQEADRFASAFLMPERSILGLDTQFITVDRMVQYKKKWGVSVAALNYRLHAVGVTSDWLYRSFCIEISRRGFRKKEPDGMSKEKPQVYQKILSLLKARGVSQRSMADDIFISYQELNSLIFNSLMVSVPGSKSKANVKTSSNVLKLVYSKN